MGRNSSGEKEALGEPRQGLENTHRLVEHLPRLQGRRLHRSQRDEVTAWYKPAQPLALLGELLSYVLPAQLDSVPSPWKNKSLFVQAVFVRSGGAGKSSGHKLFWSLVNVLQVLLTCLESGGLRAFEPLPSTVLPPSPGAGISLSGLMTKERP